MKQGQLKSKPHCPNCKKLLDGFTRLPDKAKPKPGDISVCLYCGEILEFTDDLQLIHADADTIAQVDFPELQQAHRISAAFRESNQRKN